VLADDKDWQVKVEVAANPNTPKEILEELLKDSTLEVRGAARKALKDLLKISKRE